MDPDWVMLGVANGENGVLVFASSDLSQAELEVERDEWDCFGDPWGRLAPGRTVVHLRTTMGSYVMVAGKTYGDAIRTLFRDWSPGQERTALEPPRSSLTP